MLPPLRSIASGLRSVFTGSSELLGVLSSPLPNLDLSPPVFGILNLVLPQCSDVFAELRSEVVDAGLPYC